MAEEQESDKAPVKKKKGKLILVIVAVVALLGVAGGGFYFWRSSVSAASSKKKAKQAPPVEEAKSKDETDGQSDADVKKIVELQPFIVNLADTEQARYLRMTVSLGVGGDDSGSEKPDQVFTTKVRNAMLAVLTDKKSDEVLSTDGKAKLRRELLQAAQNASEEPEVKAVYITDFIVQL